MLASSLSEFDPKRPLVGAAEQAVSIRVTVGSGAQKCAAMIIN
jgi:hypothetical protein